MNHILLAKEDLETKILEEQRGLKNAVDELTHLAKQTGVQLIQHMKPTEFMEPRIPGQTQARDFNFSEREQTILKYLSQGMTNLEIALSLNLPILVVKTTISEIFQKLSASKQP